MSATFPDPKRVCILSGRFTRSEFLYSWNHYAYARAQGYTYIGCEWPTGAVNRYVTKFMYLKHYISLFDYVFWIDDDAFFLKLDQGLERFIPRIDKIASFCKSPINKSIFTYLSSGQFLIRNTPQSTEFINAVIETPTEMVKDWWREDLGMFTKGDQDAIVYLLHEDERFRNSVDLHHYMSFNSRLVDLESTPDEVFLLHFTGPRERKLADAARAAMLLDRGPSLIPKDIEQDLLGGRSQATVFAAMGFEAVPKSKKKRRSQTSWLRHWVARVRGEG